MANNFLIDAAARQAHWVERYKNRTANVAVESLAAVKKAILAEVASGDISSLEAVQELQSVVDEILSAGLSETMGDFSGELKEFGSTQAVFEAATIGKAAKETAKIITPTAAQIWAVANTRPFATKLLRQTFSDFTADAKKLIKNQIQTAFFEGYTLPDLVKSLKGSPQMGLADGAFGNIERKLKLTIRTSISHLASSARDKVYQENSNVVTGVEWVATLDTKTSPVCRGLDGQIFPVDSGQRPPAHPNCRSTTIPVINPDLLLNPDSTGIRPAKGADGRETVSGKETYDSWLRKQPDDFQADVMGEKKAKLFRDGELKMDKFVDDGRELSLVQLQERYPKAWAKAGMDDKPTKIVPPVKPKAKPAVKRKKDARASNVKPKNYETADKKAVERYENAFGQSKTYDGVLARATIPREHIDLRSGAYYQRLSGGRINMGTLPVDTRKGKTVYRHEFGHHLDMEVLGGFSHSKSYNVDYMKDADINLLSAKGLAKEYKAQRMAKEAAADIHPSLKTRITANERLIKESFSKNASEIWIDVESRNKTMRPSSLLAEFKSSKSTARRLYDLVLSDEAAIVGGGKDAIVMRFGAALIEAERMGDNPLLIVEAIWNHGGAVVMNTAHFDSLAVADTLHSIMTRTRGFSFGGGHSIKYLKNSGNDKLEAFANIFATLSDESDPIFMELMQKIAPNQVGKIKGLINGEL